MSARADLMKMGTLQGKVKVTCTTRNKLTFNGRKTEDSPMDDLEAAFQEIGQALSCKYGKDVSRQSACSSTNASIVPGCNDTRSTYMYPTLFVRANCLMLITVS